MKKAGQREKERDKIESKQQYRGREEGEMQMKDKRRIKEVRKIQ